MLCNSAIAARDAEGLALLNPRDQLAAYWRVAQARFKNQEETMVERLSRQPERLHHHAYVVKDQEINRRFFEDTLGLPRTAT